MSHESIDVDALGELALIHLREQVSEVRLRPDAHYDHVEMILCLREDSWANRETVIDLMVGLRAHHFDDFSIEYTFGDASTSSAMVDGPYVSQRERVFAA